MPEPPRGDTGGDAGSTMELDADAIDERLRLRDVGGSGLAAYVLGSEYSGAGSPLSADVAPLMMRLADELR
jgi:hypothetical protein